MVIQWVEPETPNGQVTVSFRNVFALFVQFGPIDFQLSLFPPLLCPLQGYKIYYTTDPNQPMASWKYQMVDNNQLTTISDLDTHTIYTIRVQALTSVGPGPLSTPVQIKTQQGVPSQPEMLTAIDIGETTVTLQWNKPIHSAENILSYELYWNDTYAQVGERSFLPLLLFSPALLFLSLSLSLSVSFFLSLSPNGKEQLRSIYASVVAHDRRDRDRFQEKHHRRIPVTENYTLTGLYPNTLYYVWLAARSQRGEGATTIPYPVRTKQYGKQITKRTSEKSEKKGGGKKKRNKSEFTQRGVPIKNRFAIVRDGRGGEKWKNENISIVRSIDDTHDRQIRASTRSRIVLARQVGGAVELETLPQVA